MASVREIVQEMNLPNADRERLYTLLVSIQTDLAALATSISGVTAQLDADDTVTDTDYAANNDPTLTTTA